MKNLAVRRGIVVLLSIFCCSVVFAQLQSQERQLVDLGKRILSYENTPERIKLNQCFDSILRKMVVSEGGFEYPFDSIRSMSVITSPDSVFKIYNWAFPQRDNYRYFAYVHFREGNKMVKLIDRSPFIRDYKYKELSSGNWYGVLYYDIALHQVQGQEIYTLLGWDINTPKTKKRIIEVFTLREGNLVFGRPIFDLGKKDSEKYSGIVPQDFRLVYEYVATSKMLLRFDRNKDRIIMSHLVPLNTSVPSFMSERGPDDTFDALHFRDGKWRLKVGVNYE